MANPVTHKMMTLVLLLIAVAAPIGAQALTCTQVVGTLLPCLSYLKFGGQVTSDCCTGVRSLNTTARTTPDRQFACGCIKQAANAYGINYGFANLLPGKCGVNLGFDITPSVDCSRIK